MMTLEQIRAALADRRISMVAACTGLHVNTVIEVKNSSQANPTYRVLKALSDYLSNPQQKAD